jgi:hypothetical protein
MVVGSYEKIDWPVAGAWDIVTNPPPFIIPHSTLLMITFFVRRRIERAQIRIVTALILCAVPGLPCAGQVFIDVGPLIGYYRPTGRFDAQSIYSTALPNSPEALAGRAWGGEATAHFHGRFGLRAEGAISSTAVGAVTTPGGPRGPTSSSIEVGSLQAQYSFVADRDRRFWIGAGPGFVHRGGDAYADAGSPTQLAAAAGLGGDAAVAKHLRIAAGMSALMYTLNIPLPANLALNPGKLESGQQTDLLFHAGLVWAP